MNEVSGIHRDFFESFSMLYQINNFTYHNLIQEEESQDYGACKFEIDDLYLGQFISDGYKIYFRVARTTPRKIGQFVTFWKRNQFGVIAPYDSQDNFDFLIVSTRTKESFGQFIFPKTTLLQRGILSKNGKGGKRAMRIYPPWDVVENKQARATQAWQIPYFIEIYPNTQHQKIEQLLFSSNKKL